MKENKMVKFLLKIGAAWWIVWFLISLTIAGLIMNAAEISLGWYCIIFPVSAVIWLFFQTIITVLVINLGLFGAAAIGTAAVADVLFSEKDVVDDMILFSWGGKHYCVDPSAEEKMLIVLPDGTALEVHSWLESNPPQLGEAEEMSHLFTNLKPEEIAENLNGALAVEIEKEEN